MENIIAKIKKIPKYIFIIFAVNLMLCSVIIALVHGMRNRSELQYSQMAAERWRSGKMEYSEVSVFYDSSKSLMASELSSVRNGIHKKLSEDSYIKESIDKRDWIDAYSAEKTEEVRYNDNSIKVKVYAVGGDFFQIHPIPLKNGNYLDLVSSDVNQILLDEYSAWLLFGSTEVAGMKVWIGNSVFTVTGVVQLSEDKDFLEAYGNSNAVYVPINAYSRADKKSDDKAPDVSEEEDEPLKVTCYEAVMPNPIKNYALNTVANAVGVEFKSDEEKEKDRSTLEFGGVEVVENTGRYKLIPLIQSYKKAKYVDMRTNSIVYPYWENIARYEERKDYRTLWTIAVLLIIPIATLIALIVYIYKNRRIFKAPFTKLKQFISNKMEERKTKRYYEMQKEKEEARLNDSESDDDESDDID